MLSWSALGIRARAALAGWPPLGTTGAAPGTAVVTGGTSGIGAATAEALARCGTRVIVVGRDRQRSAGAAAAIARRSGGTVVGEAADLADLAEVRALAARIGEQCTHLAALVHGAGALAPRYERTADGCERTVATHVLGPHLLTAALAPLLRAGAPASVVFVSSGGMYAGALGTGALDIDAESFRPTAAYATAKRAQVALADAWDARLAPVGVRVRSMHPGWVDTAALRSGLPRFARLLAPVLRTPAEGADTIIWLITRPELPAGFYFDRRRRCVVRLPRHGAPAPATSAALWRWCEEKTAAYRDAA